jgi:hypothetical protein
MEATARMVVIKQHSNPVNVAACITQSLAVRLVATVYSQNNSVVRACGLFPGLEAPNVARIQRRGRCCSLLHYAACHGEHAAGLGCLVISTVHGSRLLGGCYSCMQSTLRRTAVALCFSVGKPIMRV